MSRDQPRLSAQFRLDPPRLREFQDLRERGEFTPCDARYLAAEFGELAVWALADDVLELAASRWDRKGKPAEADELRKPPSLPRDGGSCNVLCALDNPDAGWPLRPGFFLPLQWRRRRDKTIDETRRLPQALRELAGHVLLLMHAWRSAGKPSTPEDWELTLNVPQPERYDLSGWTGDDFTADSGWAALAAGWLLADRGGLPHAGVAASAAWNDGHGLSPVTRLPAKADACRRHGVETLFVAAGQQDTHALPVACEFLPNQNANPLTSLQPLLRRLLVPPAENAELPERSLYYQNLRTLLNQEDEAWRYYVERLLPEVAEDCRRQLPETVRHLIGNCRVLTLVSWSAELVELTAAVLRPLECLPLCTQETARAVDQVRQRLAESLPGCRLLDPVTIPNEVRDSLDEIAGREPLVEFVRSDPERTVIDLKPGTKTLTAALELLARRHGAWAYILQNVQAGLRDIQPGQESPFLYRPL